MDIEEIDVVEFGPGGQGGDGEVGDLHDELIFLRYGWFVKSRGGK